MRSRLARVSLVLATAGVLLAPPALAAEREVTLASTTSTQASGLFDHLLPRFTRATGIAVRVVAVGSGQAMRLGERGDADVLLVHDPPAEEAFVAAGHGIDRRPVMSNDFVLVGPRSDPARIAGTARAADALAAIARARAPFVSRGDDSGTHAKERALWRAAGLDPSGASGTWYRETGSGMGATLNTASAMGAYALADRATWLAFGNPGDLAILVEGDPLLANPYAVIRVDPARHPHLRAEEARRFADWIVSAEGQAAIGAFEIRGRRVFVPHRGER